MCRCNEKRYKKGKDGLQAILSVKEKVEKAFNENYTILLSSQDTYFLKRTSDNRKNTDQAGIDNELL